MLIHMPPAEQLCKCLSLFIYRILPSLFTALHVSLHALHTNLPSPSPSSPYSCYKHFFSYHAIGIVKKQIPVSGKKINEAQFL